MKRADPWPKGQWRRERGSAVRSWTEALASAYSLARRMTNLSRVKRQAPLVLALTPALWLALRAAREIPLSHDHPTHLFKAWHFWTEMLAHGRLHGWSQFW